MGVVLITGAAQRVGAGLARALALAGWDVAIHHRSHGEEAEALAKTLRGLGVRSQAFAADLADPAQRDGLIPAVVAAFGGIDALVNNASLFRYDTLETLTDASWRDHVDANLTAPVFLARDLARAVGEAGGVLVNILDHKWLAPNPDYFAYTASKMGLAALTPTLALALAPRVRVVGVAPGLLLPSGPQSQSDFEEAWVKTPLGRGATVDDIAAAVLYALTAPALTGQVLTVDGGDFLQRRPRDVAFDDGA